MVLERANNKNRLTYWNCKCDCGKVKEVRASHLRSGKIKSCGCYAKEVSAQAKIKRNNIEICENFAKVYLFNDKNFVIIDIEDVPKIKDYCWNITHYGYASTHINMQERLFMHRLIMGVSDKTKVVDHINHNKLDNRKSNLRVFNSNTYNLHNIKPNPNTKTGIRNISFNNKRNKYYVCYKRFNKKYYVGCFDNIEIAKQKLIESITKNNFIHGGF